MGDSDKFTSVSFVSRPCPAFCHLQYGKWESWVGPGNKANIILKDLGKTNPLCMGRTWEQGYIIIVNLKAGLLQNCKGSHL